MDRVTLVQTARSKAPATTCAIYPMTQEEIERIRRKLLAWGRKHYKQYPWRRETDAWLTLFAELLLQRTRASQVAAVYPVLASQFPTAQSFLAGGERAARQVSDRLGLHSRGRLLLDVARYVVDRRDRLSEEPQELLRVPGIGEYTAAAWLSLHAGRRAPIVDSNIVRWLSRMTGRPYRRDPRGVRWIHDLIDRLTPKRAFRDFNYAVLDFTMDICRPKNPKCGSCPMTGDCAFFLGHLHT